MIKFLSNFLSNKYALSLTAIFLIVIFLILYIFSLKLENSNKVNELQKANNQLSSLTIEKNNVDEKLLSSQLELNRLINSIKIKDDIINKLQADIINLNDSKNKKIDDIKTLGKIDDEVSKFLNTDIPDSLFIRLSSKE